ncbi:hypothetical protein GTU45_005029 [Salmonella enterica]|nr:hypothetical protein [Salmonella enterica subsp. enterica serovar Kentucky]
MCIYLNLMILIKIIRGFISAERELYRTDPVYCRLCYIPRLHLQRLLPTGKSLPLPLT